MLRFQQYWHSADLTFSSNIEIWLTDISYNNFTGQSYGDPKYVIVLVLVPMTFQSFYHLLPFYVFCQGVVSEVAICNPHKDSQPSSAQTNSLPRWCRWVPKWCWWWWWSHCLTILQDGVSDKVTQSHFQWSLSQRIKRMQRLMMMLKQRWMGYNEFTTKSKMICILGCFRRKKTFFKNKLAEPANHQPWGYFERIQKDFWFWQSLGVL